MTISIVPAQAVPEVFAERMETRQESDQALVASMTVDFENNPVTQALVEYGLPGDVFALDLRGHRHGFASIVAEPREHKKLRDDFKEKFPGEYVILGQGGGKVKDSLLGRSHIKAKVVGNKVLSLGDVNCAPTCFDEMTGLMFDFESDEFTSFLAEFAGRNGNFRAEEESGERIQLDDYSEILIDYGRRGESLILDSLLDDLRTERLSSAKMSSSYIPSGRLDRLLCYHERAGRNIDFYSNNPSKYAPPISNRAERYFQLLNKLRACTPWKDLRPDKFNHLKTAVLTYEDGSKIAYGASHAFHEFPVRAGTAEVALRTSNLKLVEEIEDFMIDNLQAP